MRFFGALIVASAISCVGADAPTTFQQAVEIAQNQEKLPELKQYSSDNFMPSWQQTMAPVFQSCFKSVRQPDGSSFALVAAIGPGGRVLRVYVDHETNISQCLVATLKGEQFPAPPESPYYQHIEMHFAPPPPSNAWPKGAPPLVVEPHKYSYTFGVPAEWEFNFEQAYEHGSSLAYFPKGGSFADSGSVVYVNVFGDDCPGGCTNFLPESISQVVGNLKGDNLDVKVDVAEPIVTKDGLEVPIRLLRGAKDLRDPKSLNNEAVAFIAHNEAIILVVLASRNPQTWEEDYAVFREIVSGHRFFTCNSPGLAVPCRK
jgi:hypothetical protein